MHNKGIFYRRWVAIAAALVVLAGGPFCGRAENVEQKDVDVAVVRDTQLGAQMAIADYYGYFKDEGLSVPMHWVQSGADIITVMAGGSAYLAPAASSGRCCSPPSECRSRRLQHLPTSPRPRALSCHPG